MPRLTLNLETLKNLSAASGLAAVAGGTVAVTAQGQGCLSVAGYGCEATRRTRLCGITFTVC